MDDGLTFFLFFHKNLKISYYLNLCVNFFPFFLFFSITDIFQKNSFNLLFLFFLTLYKDWEIQQCQQRQVSWEEESPPVKKKLFGSYHATMR